jgi:hypothetical protein
VSSFTPRSAATRVSQLKAQVGGVKLRRRSPKVTLRSHAESCKASLLESCRKLHSQFCMAEPGKTFPNVIVKSKRLITALRIAPLTEAANGATLCPVLIPTMIAVR